MDAELFRILSKAVEDLDLEWAPPEEPSRSRLDEWFLPGHRQAPRQRSAPFFPEVHDELTKSWRALYFACLRTTHYSALTSVDGSEEKGYEHLPPLNEAVVAHLCPPTAVGWKTKRALPSKPCRTTSALAGGAYTCAGQSASVLHTMAILQVFQAKLLCSLDESSIDAPAFRDLRSATDLALHATKATAQAIGQSMANLVVLERHLWLNLTEIKEMDKTAFLDAPVSPSGLFGPAVEGFTECFTTAQKSSQAMQHFLPKRSSSMSASSRPKSAPAQQNKPALSTSQNSVIVLAPQSAPPSRGNVRDPGRRFRWTRRLLSLPELSGRKRMGQSLAKAGPPQKLFRSVSPPPLSVPGVGDMFSVVLTGPKSVASMPNAVLMANTINILPSQRKSKFPLPLSPVYRSPIGGPSSDTIQPLVKWAEAWQAIPGVSSWVLGTISRDYSLQFARRPLRFSGVLQTSVNTDDAHVLQAEVTSLRRKGAIEILSPSESNSGFYSRYFLVPKKDGGLRPILDLRLLNLSLMRRNFKMLTLKQILTQVCPGLTGSARWT
ncbi:uncharacterized protein [Chanodichthys erythropterus]|uniref:uncharacterized protein n=1 Tax=Chanodichthys erythropterus TaxID=933992 RepID=UPI00351F193E